MVGALEGIRIVDMTTTVMGPSATQLLGDHGADVIKIESPSGDTTRHVPPMRNADMGTAFLQLNRNKRSVVLNLKRQDHNDAFVKLLKSADIFVSNVRPQGLARVGVTPERLAELNPRLITVSLVGFGTDGPYAGRPVYEDLIQGLTAIPSLLTTTGGGEPHYVPVAFNDRAVGQHAAAVMMVALYHRDRTGTAQHVEVPMYETMATFVLGDHMGGRAFEPPIGPPGYQRTLTTERRPYQTKDGYICVIVYTDRHWKSFLELTGRSNLLEADERFKDLESRTINADATYAVVREELAKRTTAEWLEALRDADVPATPLHTLDSIFDDPQLAATGFFLRSDHPTEGSLVTPLGPARWSKTPPGLRRPAPRHGEHTVDVLTELGYGEDEAKAMASRDG